MTGLPLLWLILIFAVTSAISVVTCSALKRDIAFRGLMHCAHDGCMLMVTCRKRNMSITGARGIGASATSRVFAKKF
jgi:hypothetical protein